MGRWHSATSIATNGGSDSPFPLHDLANNDLFASDRATLSCCRQRNRCMAEHSILVDVERMRLRTTMLLDTGGRLVSGMLGCRRSDSSTYRNWLHGIGSCIDQFSVEFLFGIHWAFDWIDKRMDTMGRWLFFLHRMPKRDE